MNPINTKTNDTGVRTFRVNSALITDGLIGTLRADSLRLYTFLSYKTYRAHGEEVILSDDKLQLILQINLTRSMTAREDLRLTELISYQRLSNDAHAVYKLLDH